MRHPAEHLKIIPGSRNKQPNEQKTFIDRLKVSEAVLGELSEAFREEFSAGDSDRKAPSDYPH